VPSPLSDTVGSRTVHLYLGGKCTNSLRNGSRVSGVNAPGKMKDDANQMTILATSVIARRDLL